MLEMVISACLGGLFHVHGHSSLRNQPTDHKLAVLDMVISACLGGSFLGGSFHVHGHSSLRNQPTDRGRF